VKPVTTDADKVPIDKPQTNNDDDDDDDDGGDGPRTVA